MSTRLQQIQSSIALAKSISAPRCKQALMLFAGAKTHKRAQKKQRTRARHCLSNAQQASVPIPKFASVRGILSCELRNQRNTSDINVF